MPSWRLIAAEVLAHIGNQHSKQSLIKRNTVRKGFYDLADAYQKMHVNY